MVADKNQNNSFTFSGGLRTVLLVLMGIGLLSLVLTFFKDDEYHTRFWSNILLNSVFFMGIAFMALFLYATHLVGWSGWHTAFKRVWEGFYQFLIPGLVLMLIIGGGTWFGYHKLYEWSIPELVEGDTILQGKSWFLNKGWYVFGTLIMVGIWIFVGNKLRTMSIREDKEADINFTLHNKMRKWGAFFLPIAGFFSAALVWLWVMSVDPHWYSTLFAWYNGASWCVSMCALTILVLIYLKSQGYYNVVNADHFHDLGKYVFAFSIFWTYLWFSQYMLIWYGNVGEETIYFRHRIDNYPVLFYGNLVINFVLPFLILMSNNAKRKYGTLTLITVIVFIGHWLDFFLMLKPGIYKTAHHLSAMGGGHGADAGHGAEHGAEAAGHAVEHASGLIMGFQMPGLLEIGTLIGFLGLFLWVVFRSLSKAPLVAARDPYIEESYHHEVIMELKDQH
jgi:hypothetical protein